MTNANHNTEIKIEKFCSQKDCEGIIRCISACFGSTYVKPKLYTEHGIMDMHRKGEISLYLGKASNGTVAGIIGVESSPLFPDRLELCTLAVLPEYRKSGIGSRLLSFLFDEIHKSDCLSAYAYPIAAHFNAQLAIKKLKPVCCGFYPSVFSTERFNSGETGHINPKDSLTIVVFPMQKRDCGTLYIRADESALAENTYKKLGVQFSVDNTSSPPHQEKTEYRYSYDDIHSTLYININSIGCDLCDIIKQITAQKNKWFTAELCLNISDSAAVHAAKLLRENGFIHTGFQPLCKNAEYSVFHYSGSVSFDIDDLCYIEEQADFADNIRRQLNERVKT